MFFVIKKQKAIPVLNSSENEDGNTAVFTTPAILDPQFCALTAPKPIC